MAGISQVIRWRQGRAMVTPKRAKLQKAANTQRQTPPGGDSGSASDSAKVSLAGTTAAQSNSPATYTDRVKRPKLRSATDAAKAARNRGTSISMGTGTSAGSEPAAVADAHVREALAHFAKVAQAGRGSADATPAQTPPVAATSQVGVEMDWSVSSEAEEAAQPEADKLAEAARADAEAAQARKTDSDAAEADQADADRARTERAGQERAERERAQASRTGNTPGARTTTTTNTTNTATTGSLALAAGHATPARAEPAPPQDLASADEETADDEWAAAAAGEASASPPDANEPAAEATGATPAEVLGRSLQAQRWLLGGASAPPAAALRAHERASATAGSLAVATATVTATSGPASGGAGSAATAGHDTPTAYASHEARRLWETGADPAHPAEAPHFDLRS